MRGVYTAAAKAPGITASGTLAYFTAPSGKVVKVTGITVTNENNATNYQGEIQVNRITTLGSPSNYSAVTPTPHEAGDQAAGSTCNVASSNSRTEPTTYGATIQQEGFASLVGYRYEAVDDIAPIYVANGASIGIKLATTPGASTDFDVRITFVELG